MNHIAQRLRSLAARTALDGIAEEMRAIADEIALAQQAQEPVAWLYVDTVGERYLCFSRPTGGGTITNLYTAPPAPQPAAPVVSEDDLVACLISSGCVGTVMPAAVVAEVYQSRYTIEWVNGPMPLGTNLYAGPKVVKAWAEEVPAPSPQAPGRRKGPPGITLEPQSHEQIDALAASQQKASE